MKKELDETDKLIQDAEVSKRTFERKKVDYRVEIDSIKKYGSREEDEVNQEIRQITDDLVNLRKRYGTNEEELSYSKIILSMLKDDGVKTKVVESYLPLINSTMNRFLEALDLFVSFEFDAEFNETIRARHRDTYTYQSFSAGERMRIDLALLLTWREVARRRNSVVTNLLIMDEVGDSTLDGEGVSNLLELLDELQDTNLFLISHRDVNEVFFDRKITVSKDIFTKIEVE